MAKRLLLSVMLLVSFSWVGRLHAQQDTTGLGVDELFTIARQDAFSGKRKEARVILRRILLRSPRYVDVRVLLGRTLAWDGLYDSARIELAKALRSDPSNADTYRAMIDNENWSEKYQAAISIADQALAKYPNDDDILVKKAMALRNLGRDYEALTLLARAEDINPSRKDIPDLREQIRSKSMDYSVSVNYTGDKFSDIYDPMHLGYLQLSRRTPYGSVFARVNYGYRFRTNGIQEELDFYPRIMNGVYGYLNYGYSESDIFPRHRAGAEVYGKLPYAMEGSLGLRYLYFGPQSTVTIYTGSLGLYNGNYYFSLRPYITPNGSSFSRSIGLLVRRYFNDADTYVSVKGSLGFTPDERNVILSTGTNGTQIYFLKAQDLGVGWQCAATNQFIFNLTFDATHQELSFSPGDFVYDYSLSAGVRYIF